MSVMTMQTKQAGAALLVSLIILLILSIIGISAMRGGLLQALIASNSQQAEMAFSAADAGVSAVIYNANQQGVETGGILADATAAAGAVTEYSVDSDGAVAALADPAPEFDAERETPITAVVADVAWESCSSLCPGFSLKGDSVGCHAFQINSRGSVAGTQSQIDQWANTVGAPCPD